MHTKIDGDNLSCWIRNHAAKWMGIQVDPDLKHCIGHQYVFYLGSNFSESSRSGPIGFPSIFAKTKSEIYNIQEITLYDTYFNLLNLIDICND